MATSGNWFIDSDGRKVLLRGVNLGGSSKVPFPDGATHIPTDFSDHRDISFVNRPFNLEKASNHFERLKHWGFNCLRLLTTWEAIEHGGPKNYDNLYLDYFNKIVEVAGEYGFFIIVDPHQDVWSRMTGGDGAPGWVFEKVGLDFTKFGESGAAKVMQYHYPEEYKPMEWSFNYGRFATATMFTLFFGSEDFAPQSTIDSQSIQSYLQSHFINAIKTLAEKIKHHEHIIGFGAMNEPHHGYIGIEDLGKLPDLTPPGLVPTPFDTLVAGDGVPREVAKFVLRFIWLRKEGTGTLNPKSVSNWIENSEDIWKKHGIWKMNGAVPELLKPHYFRFKPDGKPVDFFRDYLRPFIKRYTKEIRSIVPDWLIFLEGEPLKTNIFWKDSDPLNIVNASHWYDGYTLYTKSYRNWLSFDLEKFRPVFSAKNVKKLFRRQLSDRKKMSSKIQNGIPTLIGEFGIPYDMNNKHAYKTGDFSNQISALSLYYDLLDELQLHSTQWNYTADNNNQWGDQWNLEDLSIYSKDQEIIDNSLDSGGRAIAGFCRPYPQRISGSAIEWKFDTNSGEFLFSFLSDKSIATPTIIYLPPIHYKNGITFTVKSESSSITTKLEGNILSIYSGENEKISLQIFPQI